MVVNNYAQYCSVVKTGFGKAKLVIGGEVDAREPHDSIYLHGILSLIEAKSGTASRTEKTMASTGWNSRHPQRLKMKGIRSNSNASY